MGAVPGRHTRDGEIQLKVVVFGLGSIGRRHARLVTESGEHRILAFRSGSGASGNDLGVRETRDWDDVRLFDPDVAIISNPTSSHVETANRCAGIDCALFIEKPIGSNDTGLDDLLEEVDRRNLVTYVAYNLRHHPVVRYLKEHIPNSGLRHYRSECLSWLPSWRPGTDHVRHYSARKELGGGVILELSHELDLAEYLMGGLSNLRGATGRVSNVTLDAEDYADILFDSSEGAGSIHLNFFSHLNKRTIEVDYPEFSLSGDLVGNSIVKSEKGITVFREEFTVDRDTTYRNQLDYFFQNIENQRMENNLFEAAELFRNILTFQDSSTI